MSRANLIRGLVLIAVAGFFVFRLFQLGSTIYYAYIAVFGVAGLLGLIGLLQPKWQNMLLNLGISLVFLDFVFADIEWQKFFEALADANYWWLIPSTLALLAHLFFRTLRWQWLLKPMGEVRFWPAFRALVIGITGNVVLPARAGEFLRAYVLGRSSRLSAVGVFATLVVERIFDGFTVLLVLLGVIAVGFRNADLQRAGIIGAIFYGGAVVVLVVFVVKRDWADFLINKFLPGHLGEIVSKIFHNFVDGLAVLRNPQQMGMVLLYNVLTWVFIPVSFWFALQTFDFGSPVPWTAAVLLLPAMALALTVPGAPGGVGLVQLAVKITLDATFAGLTLAPDFIEKVAAASILIHLSQFVPEVVAGVIAFAYEGLSTSDIKAGQQLAASGEAAGGK